MKNHKKILKFTEVFLLSFVWLVILSTPILFREDNQLPVWHSITKQLESFIPLTILFVVNRFFLVPLLLFREKPGKYIFSILGTIAVFTIILFFYHTSLIKDKQQRRDFLTNQRFFRQTPPPVIGERNIRPLPPQPEGPRPIPPYANFLILSFLIVGFDTGLRSTLRWTEVQKEKVQLEKENVANQLVMLRNQVSPHFFMNTLNNIHSLVDINTSEAKESIIKLSKMMRYLLYETEAEKTTLKREVEFLKSYIDLMKLRFSEKVSVTLTLPDVIPDKTIPPFLFTSIIENAFKHGVSYKDESFIRIEMEVGTNRLMLGVKNSKTDNEQSKEFSGIGVENTRRRLDLLYGNQYHLDLIDSEKTFTVNLSIPL